jgi:hypothetical protein
MYKIGFARMDRNLLLFVCVTGFFVSFLPQLPEYLGFTNLTHFLPFCAYLRKKPKGNCAVSVDEHRDSWVGRKLAKISSSKIWYFVQYKNTQVHVG